MGLLDGIHVAILSFCAGAMPPMPILGGSLLNVQMGIGNVDANAMICHLLRVLCLPCVTYHTRSPSARN